MGDVEKGSWWCEECRQFIRHDSVVQVEKPEEKSHNCSDCTHAFHTKGEYTHHVFVDDEDHKVVKYDLPDYDELVNKVYQMWEKIYNGR